MLREIRVYGPLAKLLKRRKFRAEVSSVAEAVRFLIANFPFLEKYMCAPDRYYRVTVAERDLTEDDIGFPVGSTEVIKIIPVVAGAGVAGRIILGVALVALSFAIPGLAFNAVLAGQIASGVGNAILLGGKIAGLIGASLALGGIAQLIAPIPKLNKDDRDPRKSFSFSGVQQTSRQGTPVPIVYGERIIGSVVVSAGLDTVQVAA